MSNHSESGRDIVLPRSQFYYGPYGRMFRNLPPHEPARGEEGLIALGQKMHENEEDEDNPIIPAGYTYFGQFIDHDITFDPTSSLQRQNDPNKLRNFRTPRLDLDSLYSGGPKLCPFLYRRSFRENDQHISCLLLEGKVEKHNQPDLPRKDMQALIGDPRNDENVIVSQIHLAFIKFHNKVVEHLAAKKPLKIDLFTEAQRIVRWHYQWVVIHDFLKFIVGKETFNRIRPKSKNPHEPNLKFYNWKNQPFIPVEFSVAAFRFGHSMVRSSYVLNDKLEEERIKEEREGAIPIIRNQPDIFTDDLRGGRDLPKHWTIQWNRFLCFESDGHNVARKHQMSKKINAKLTPGLRNLLSSSEKDREEKKDALAVRNLLRGWRMGLPSGQAVARAMGINKPLSPERIAPKKDEAISELLLGQETPLWYYVLKEAELQDGGGCLGKVGGAIVAEVLFGLLAGDPTSYLNVDPLWTPEKEGIIGVKDIDQFGLSDIIGYSGMPVNIDDINLLFG